MSNRIAYPTSQPVPGGESGPPTGFVFDHATVEPLESVANFVQQLIRSRHRKEEKRAAKRYPISMNVNAVELDESFEPQKDPFIAVTRDISTGGLCLIYTRPVTCPYLGMELPNPRHGTIQTILEVLRCRSVGIFYEIAGRFVARPESS